LLGFGNVGSDPEINRRETLWNTVWESRVGLIAFSTYAELGRSNCGGGLSSLVAAGGGASVRELASGRGGWRTWQVAAGGRWWPKTGAIAGAIESRQGQRSVSVNNGRLLNCSRYVAPFGAELREIVSRLK
jgi:hypothetical protein